MVLCQPVLLTILVNTNVADWWCDGTKASTVNDDQDAEDVPPDADVIEQRDQPDAELVQQPVQEQHARVDHDV